MTTNDPYAVFYDDGSVTYHFTDDNGDPTSSLFLEADPPKSLKIFSRVPAVILVLHFDADPAGQH